MKYFRITDESLCLTHQSCLLHSTNDNTGCSSRFVVANFIPFFPHGIQSIFVKTGFDETDGFAGVAFDLMNTAPFSVLINVNFTAKFGDGNFTIPTDGNLRPVPVPCLNRLPKMFPLAGIADFLIKKPSACNHVDHPPRE